MSPALAAIYVLVLPIIMALVGLLRPILEARLIRTGTAWHDAAFRLLTLGLTIVGGLAVYFWRDNPALQVAGAGLFFGLTALGAYHAINTGKSPAPTADPSAGFITSGTPPDPETLQPTLQPPPPFPAA